MRRWNWPWANNDEIMSHGEGVVRRIAKTLLDERSDELASLDRDLDLVARYADNPYPRMRYDEAVGNPAGDGRGRRVGPRLGLQQGKGADRRLRRAPLLDALPQSGQALLSPC